MEGEVRKCYDNGVVFITGGTGFLGKILLQKLLRYKLAKKIFLLVRCKKGKSEAERYADIFEYEIFDSIKKEQPDYLSRIELITGDCVAPNMGISDSDWAKLRGSVNFVFHCAATVRFDQKIKTAAYINVRSTRDLVRNIKEFKNLKAFVHVSTAYANCTRKVIDEEFYEAGLSPQKLFDIFEILTDEQLNEITPTLLGEWPNTYTFTKCMSEDVIRTDCPGLPVALVRPSIVLSAYNEPLPGWIDNYYGPISSIAASGLGILRLGFVEPDYYSDMVPADYVVNTIMVAAAKVSKTTAKERENISIYNCVSFEENPITWRRYSELCIEIGRRCSSNLAIYIPIMIMVNKRWLFRILWFFLHEIPGYIIDFICLLMGKKRQMIDGYEKLLKFIYAASFFACRQWDFKNKHTQKLWEELGEEDKKLFPFSMKEFDWDLYVYKFLLGGRIYLVKESLDTIPAGKRRYKKLEMIHIILKSIFGCICLFLLYICFNKIIS